MSLRTHSCSHGFLASALDLTSVSVPVLMSCPLPQKEEVAAKVESVLAEVHTLATKTVKKCKSVGPAHIVFINNSNNNTNCTVPFLHSKRYSTVNKVTIIKSFYSKRIPSPLMSYHHLSLPLLLSSIFSASKKKGGMSSEDEENTVPSTVKRVSLT